MSPTCRNVARLRASSRDVTSAPVGTPASIVKSTAAGRPSGMSAQPRPQTQVICGFTKSIQSQNFWILRSRVAGAGPLTISTRAASAHSALSRSSGGPSTLVTTVATGTASAPGQLRADHGDQALDVVGDVHADHGQLLHELVDQQ